MDNQSKNKNFKKRPMLLYLTDLSNNEEDEDIFISNFLRKDFRVVIGHPADCRDLEDKADAIIIRNTWNEKRYGQPEPWYGRWRNKAGLPMHDDLYQRKGEFYSETGGSKDYLIWLYQKGFPVIPTVSKIENIGQLPKTDFYFIKPQDGFDAINARKITKKELLSSDLEGYLIQPYVDFDYEISFYYLDKQLQYTLFAPNKAKRWDLMEFVPSDSDLEFAKKFIQWNPQKRGIERIDACRTKDGELLLVEITDQGGAYLSILDLSKQLQRRFLKSLSKSLQKISNYSKQNESDYLTG